jgi:hypothetical protein
MVWTVAEFHGWYIGLNVERKQRAWAGRVAGDNSELELNRTVLDLSRT